MILENKVIIEISDMLVLAFWDEDKWQWYSFGWCYVIWLQL